MSYLLKRLELKEAEREIERSIKEYLNENDLKTKFDIIIVDVFKNVAKFHVASVYQNTSIIEFDLGSGSLNIVGSDRPVSMSVVSEAIKIVKKFIWEEN